MLRMQGQKLLDRLSAILCKKATTRVTKFDFEAEAQLDIVVKLLITETIIKWVGKLLLVAGAAER